MYAAPPVPPPKPGSHEVSRIGTPTVAAPAPGAPQVAEASHLSLPEAASSLLVARSEPVVDPGDQWLPKYLEDKPKQDLADILSSPALLSALTHSASTIHPSLAVSHSALQAALAENVELAQHLQSLEARLVRQRDSTQAQLLGARALERQWGQKQRDMDAALAPFAPDGLYLRLAQACQEQSALCDALEESFLDHNHTHAQRRDDADGPATERELLDWVRRYREARKLLYLRQERKERWDEGRVGGWR